MSYIDSSDQPFFFGALPTHVKFQFTDASGFPFSLGTLVFCVSSPEIVSYREANANNTTVDPPKIDDPAFRALVEENVKDSVFNVVISPVMQQHWGAYIAQGQSQNNTSTSAHRRAADPDAPLKPVYVHGE